MLLLSNEDVERVLTMPDCIAALEDAYREQAQGNAANAVRSDVPSGVLSSSCSLLSSGRPHTATTKVRGSREALNAGLTVGNCALRLVQSARGSEVEKSRSPYIPPRY